MHVCVVEWTYDCESYQTSEHQKNDKSLSEVVGVELRYELADTTPDLPRRDERSLEM